MNGAGTGSRGSSRFSCFFPWLRSVDADGEGVAPGWDRFSNLGRPYACADMKEKPTVVTDSDPSSVGCL